MSPLFPPLSSSLPSHTYFNADGVSVCIPSCCVLYHLNYLSLFTLCLLISIFFLTSIPLVSCNFQSNLTFHFFLHNHEFLSLLLLSSFLSSPSPPSHVNHSLRSVSQCYYGPFKLPVNHKITDIPFSRLFRNTSLLSLPPSLPLSFLPFSSPSSLASLLT